MEASHNSINYLSDQECKIYYWTDSLLNRTRNEVGLSFKKEDIHLDYLTIHREYLTIFKSSKDKALKLEVLKRLIFLNWMFGVESDVFTGIKALDKTAINDSYRLLNTYIELKVTDYELIWMLKYYSSWDWIILDYCENKPMLSQFVKSVETSRTHFPENQLPAGTMDYRGQMGLYWKPKVERIDKT